MFKRRLLALWMAVLVFLPTRGLAQVSAEVPVELIVPKSHLTNTDGAPTLSQAGELSFAATLDGVEGVHVYADDTVVATYQTGTDIAGGTLKVSNFFRHLNNDRSLLLEAKHLYRATESGVDYIVGEDELINIDHILSPCLATPLVEKPLGNFSGVQVKPSGYFAVLTDLCGYIGGKDAQSLEVLVPGPSSYLSPDVPVSGDPSGQALVADRHATTYYFDVTGPGLAYVGAAECPEGASQACYDAVGFGSHGIITVEGGAGHFSQVFPIAVGEGEAIDSANRIRRNSSGKLLYEAGLSTGGKALALADGDSATVIARTGDAMPGTDGETFETFSFYPDSLDLLAMGFEKGVFAIADSGDVYFVAGTDHTQFSTPKLGIFHYRDGELTRILLSGDEAPGFDDGTKIQFITSLRVSSAGRVAFTVTLSGDFNPLMEQRYAVYSRGPDGKLVLVATNKSCGIGPEGPFAYGDARFDLAGYGAHPASGGHAFDAEGRLIFAGGRGLMRATFEDVASGEVSLVVNSTGDKGNGDSLGCACYTGDTLPSGEAECTLRAALQVAAARVGPDTITFELPAGSEIRPMEPLPIIKEDLTLVSDAGVVLDGSDSKLIPTRGLWVEDGALVVSGLTIRNFAGDGIRFESPKTLKLTDMDISNNCRWGVYAVGPVHVDGEEGGSTTSVISDNGTGAASNCLGGGVLNIASAGTSDFSVVVRQATIEGNNGPGILSQGSVMLQDVTVRDNTGDGVAVDGDDLAVLSQGIRIEHWTPDSESVISGNGGHGLHAAAGNVTVVGKATINDNAGWGVYVDHERFLLTGDDPQTAGYPKEVSGNGSGPMKVWAVLDGKPNLFEDPSTGGGLYSGLESSDGLSLACHLHDATVSGNTGPGVLVREALISGVADIRDNGGAGIAVVYLEHGQSADAKALWLMQSATPTVISNNGADGIWVESGALLIENAVEIEGNGGWGIFAEWGSLEAGDGGAQFSDEPKRIIGNGHAATCDVWYVDEKEWPTPAHEPCGGGGVYIGHDGDTWNHLYELEIEGNQGPGLWSQSRLHVGSLASRNNLGDGVRVDNASSDSGVVLRFYSHTTPSEVTGNAGVGVLCALGDVALDDGVRIANNAGWGLLVEAGGTTVVPDTFDPERWVAVEDNRDGDKTCYTAWYEGLRPEFAEIPCGGGGIRIREPMDLTARQLRVVGNTGDGIRSEGNVTIVDGVVCGNTGEDLVVAGETDLTNVVSDCVDEDPPPDGDAAAVTGPSDGKSSSGGGGGCGTVPAERHHREAGWLLLGIVAVLVRLRRRTVTTRGR